MINLKYIKNLGKSFLYIIGFILVLTFIVTLLSYFNIIGSKVLSILEITILCLSLFVGGFIIGKKSLKKGYLEGLKLSGIFLIILLLFNFLAFDQTFKISDLIFYLIITLSSIFGSTLGINKK